MLSLCIFIQVYCLLCNGQDFDKKLSHVNRGASSTKPVDGAGGAAGLDTMAEERSVTKGYILTLVDSSPSETDT